jgi:hypothetical protein
MKNFKWTRGGSLLYRTAETGDVLEVEVRYELGNGPVQRGIKVAVTPVKISNTDGVPFRSQLIFGDTKRSGRKLHVVTLKRKNDKALVNVAELLDEKAPEIAKAFEDSATGAEAFEMISNILNPVDIKV